MDTITPIISFVRTVIGLFNKDKAVRSPDGNRNQEMNNDRNTGTSIKAGDNATFHLTQQPAKAPDLPHCSEAPPVHT